MNKKKYDELVTIAFLLGVVVGIPIGIILLTLINVLS